MWIFIVCIILLLLGTKPDTWRKALKIIIPLTIIGFGTFMSGFIWGDPPQSAFGTSLTSAQTGLNMLSRFFSFTGLGLVLSLTTNPFALIKSMQKDGKLPRKFAYGMMAAVNLVPHMKAEYKNAHLALAVRGVRVWPLSPKVIFAMLVACFHWSEMLAIAMHSKGFHSETSSVKTTEI